MYSIDSLKTVLFGDEIFNVLDMINDKNRDNDYYIIRGYFEKRISEMKKTIKEDEYDK